jgi:hypothetical protein
MADAKKYEKKKPVSKAQAMKVAAMMKAKSQGSTPPVPTPGANPVTTDDDDEQSQGA